jgi:hypothetical protein
VLLQDHGGCSVVGEKHCRIFVPKEMTAATAAKNGCWWPANVTANNYATLAATAV